jgi:uncharacterized protein
MKNLKITTQEIRAAQRLERVIEHYHCAAIDDIVQRQDLSVSCVFETIDSEILLHGRISGTVTLACGRCLEPYLQPISLNISQAYPAELVEIDLDKELCELLILELPQKPLCREDCKGLCSQCGKNLNREQCTCTPVPADSRWDALQPLVKKKK